MASADPSIRVRYLQDAAHSLAVSSPAAAAFLGRAHNSLVEDALASSEITPKQYESSRQEICGACGNVMVPGWSYKASVRPPHEAKLKKSLLSQNKATDTTRSIIFTCLRCHRDTAQQLQPKSRRQVRQSKIRGDPEPVSTAKALNIGTDSGVTKTANANSKQRQKARKGGLQAMLAKNKTKSSSSGFDLMDFAM